jgi:hypothetical protein
LEDSPVFAPVKAIVVNQRLGKTDVVTGDYTKEMLGQKSYSHESRIKCLESLSSPNRVPNWKCPRRETRSSTLIPLKTKAADLGVPKIELPSLTRGEMLRFSHKIADPLLGEDKLRSRGVLFKLFTQMSDMDLDAIMGFRKVVAPHCLRNAGVVGYIPGSSHKMRKDATLCGGNLYLFLSIPDPQ